MESEKIVGRGATSEVFMIEEGKVIKLFLENYPLGSVEYEAKIAEIIGGEEIMAPKMYGVHEVRNRKGIVYDYISGNSLTEVFLSNPFKAKRIMVDMVDTLLGIHKFDNSYLPSQSERFIFFINKSDLRSEEKKKILEIIDNQEGATCICHGDFHTGNLIVNNSGLFVIDWMNCYSGNKEGDVLRSYLMLISPHIPLDFRSLTRFYIRIYKRWLGHLFLKNYLRKSEFCKNDIFKWWPIIAAMRLEDKVPGEKVWLLRKIKKYINKG